MTRRVTKSNPFKQQVGPRLGFAHALVAALTLACAGPLGAVTCTTFFPDGLSANDEIEFKSGSQLQGSPDNLLVADELDDSSGSTNSCNVSDCGIDSSFTSIPDMDQSSFYSDD